MTKEKTYDRRNWKIEKYKTREEFYDDVIRQEEEGWEPISMAVSGGGFLDPNLMLAILYFREDR